jgi:hypothetical protein
MWDGTGICLFVTGFRRSVCPCAIKWYRRSQFLIDEMLHFYYYNCNTVTLALTKYHIMEVHDDDDDHDDDYDDDNDNDDAIY